MPALARIRCAHCGEEVVGQDAAAVERLARLHRCPPQWEVIILG